MERNGGATTWRRIGLAVLAMIAVVVATESRSLAQGPQVDIKGAPGASFGRGMLGSQPGDSGTSGDAEDSSPRLGTVGGRAGPSVGRAGIADLLQSRHRPRDVETGRMMIARLKPAEIANYGSIDLPKGPEDLGPIDGMTLDQAIERLLAANLALLALSYEIPMADADVLTASLRNNPILYADSQLVPYGHYSNTQPGGVTQYDLNITFQLDVWGKRRARTQVAQKTKSVTQAQFQDAVRAQIDNLYTAYVDVVAADETLRYSRAFTEGAKTRLQDNLARLKAGLITPAVTDALRVRLNQAELQEDEAERALSKTTRTLALLLEIPPREAGDLKLRAALADYNSLPRTEEQLVEAALASRPDLAAFRLGTQRAQADTKLARANRFSDVYLLAQPYTYQDNRYLGFKGSHSFAVGVTVGLPLFNRNQGNIRRADLNERQTAAELAALERRVAYDVTDAILQFEMTRAAILQYRDEIEPAALGAFEEVRRRFDLGAVDVGTFIEAQKDYNEVAQKLRDALIAHRRDMLDLNTAVGIRVLP